MFDYIEKSAFKSMHIAVFTGGLSPEPEKTLSYWNSVLPVDYIIAADSGLETLIKYRDYFADKNKTFEPNLILGDMDSISSTKILERFNRSIIETSPAYKNLTDTEMALTKAHEKDNSKNVFITLVGGAGGRIDHFLGIYDLFSTSIRPSVWLTDTQALWYAPKKSVFQISNVSLKDMISISRVNGARHGGKIISNGFEWESDKFRRIGMPSISNRIATKNNGGKITLEIKHGNFIVILPLTAVIQLL